MIECLISVGVWCLIAWLLLFVAGKILALFIELPAQFSQLVMLLCRTYGYREVSDVFRRPFAVGERRVDVLVQSVPAMGARALFNAQSIAR